MKLKFNLHWNEEFQQFLASFPHNDFLSRQAPLIWLIAQDALSHGLNLVDIYFSKIESCLVSLGVKIYCLCRFCLSLETH